MRCRRVQLQLHDFSFGRLDAALTARIAAHLERCADCRRVLRREQRTAVMLGGMQPVAPDASAWTRIEAALRRESSPTSRRHGWPRPAVWAGGLAAAAALLFGLVSPLHHAPPAVESDMLRALAPTAAAGLGLERPSDPLVMTQRKLDRLLDRVADEGS
jgi:anti-sigma-K factor RskA